jgi:F-type H+-transporting ATPase subunit delta
MASSTRQAIAKGKTALEPLLAEADITFAEELFAIGAATSESKQLRNILSDPSSELAAKTGALSAIFGKSVSKKALDFVGKLVELRWSKGSDLVLAFEQLAVHSVAAIAARKGELENLESEIFAFRQVLDSDQDLQIALSSRQASVEQKLVLVKTLLSSKFSSEAALLIRYSVIGSTRRRLAIVLEHFGKLLSAYAERLVATVTVANALTADQEKRLAEALTRDYGKSLRLNIEVDPEILGGVKIQVAGEIIDGSIANRLKQARMKLA